MGSQALAATVLAPNSHHSQDNSDPKLAVHAHTGAFEMKMYMNQLLNSFIDMPAHNLCGVPLQFYFD